MADGLPASAYDVGAGGGDGTPQPPPRATRVASNGTLTDLDTDEHVADALAMLGAAAVGPQALDSAMSSARSPGGGLLPPGMAATTVFGASNVMASDVQSDSDSDASGSEEDD